MPEHIWSVLCSKAVVDSETQQVSLFEVVENLTVTLNAPLPAPPQIAAVPFRTELVSLWTRSDPARSEIASARCELITPAGNNIASSTIEMDFSKLRFRSNFRADALPIEGSGIYLFKVAVQTPGDEWKTVASLPLEVKLVEDFKEKNAAGARVRPKKKTTKQKQR